MSPRLHRWGAEALLALTVLGLGACSSAPAGTATGTSGTAGPTAASTAPAAPTVGGAEREPGRAPGGRGEGEVRTGRDEPAGDLDGAGAPDETDTATGDTAGAQTATDDPAGTDSDATAPVRQGRPGTVTIAAAGDILIHPEVQRRAAANAGGGPRDFDFTDMFSEVKPLLSAADVALCQQETPVSADNAAFPAYTKALRYYAPSQLAAAEADAGFDGCSFASNHMWDMGLPGIESTHRVLQDAGIKVSGATPSAEGAGRPTTFQVHGLTVAHLSYSYTIFNRRSVGEHPAEAPWLDETSFRVVGADGIRAAARRAKADGADFVVVSLHWGQEYETAVQHEQDTIAPDVVAGDEVDLVLGSHAHVVQPCSRVGGKVVLWGMGNFLSAQNPSRGNPVGTDAGMVAQVTLHRDESGRLTSTVRYQPTAVDWQGRTYRIQLATPDRSTAAYDRTVRTMSSGTCDAQPLS